MIYNEFKFLYPPRPEKRITTAMLKFYDGLGEYIGQPKYNGSCCNLFLIPEDNFGRIINRHGELKTRVDKTIDFTSLMQGKPMVLSGELMDKSKTGEDGLLIKGFIIWDILVYEGNYLIGSTVEERNDLMESLWPTTRMMITDKGMQHYEHLSFTGIQGIYKSPAYLTGFESLYNELIKTDAYEGLVLKKKNAKLSFGFNEKNNSNWQLKCRKPTRNYKH